MKKLFSSIYLTSLVLLIAGCVSARSVMAPAYVEPAPSNNNATLTIKFEPAGFTDNTKSANKKIYRLPGKMDKMYCTDGKAEIIAILNNIAFAAGINWYADKGKSTTNVTVAIPTHENFRISSSYTINEKVDIGSQYRPGSIEVEYCQVNLSFLPVAGKKYLASFDHNVSQCGWNLFDVTDAQKPVKVAPNDFPPCIIIKESEANDWNKESPSWIQHVNDVYNKNPQLYKQ